MLLAAGLGTRLRPLTDLRPKPIVPVANRPLAGFAMEHLARSGVRSIVANTHPEPELVESSLKSACPQGVDLRFSREIALLGTAGGLRKAQASFDDPQSPVIVMNGDTLFAPDLSRAYAAHVARGAVATMILRPTDEPERFGAIGIDQNDWVRSLLGTPEDERVRQSLMFTGIQILSPDAFSAMPESGCVIRSAYRHWVDTGAPVLGVIDESPWADLGTVAEYHRLNLELASGSFAWPGVEPARRMHPAGLARALGKRSPKRDRPRGRTSHRASTSTDASCGRAPTSPRSATNAVLTPKHRIELS